jgi:hypothetical protein
MIELLYLAGPYSGDVVANVAAARDAARWVVENRPCWFPVTPHLMTAHMEYLAPREYFLEGTLAVLERCRAVALLPGWHRSEGTLGEITRAGKLGMPVYISVQEVPER